MNPNTVVVLCNGWRRESEHAKVRVVAQRVTLPLCGENPWTRKGTPGAIRVMHVSLTVVQHKPSQ